MTPLCKQHLNPLAPDFTSLCKQGELNMAAKVDVPCYCVPDILWCRDHD